MEPEESSVESSITLTQEDKILYDLTVPCAWPEVVTALPTEEGISLWRTLAAVTRAFVSFAVEKIQHPLRSLAGYQSVPSALSTVLGASLPWKIAVTRDGTLLAVLKDEQVEIRSIVDDFESVLTTCQVPRDSLPQWRRLVWNEEGTLLAVGLSSGGVRVFLSSGRQVCELIERVSPADVGSTSPLSSMTFVPSAHDDENVVSLLSVLYYGGSLETYQIKEDGTPLFLHSFSLGDYFPNGVSNMLYHPTLNIMIVGASPSTESDPVCVSGWRLLDGPPYWAPRLGQEGLAKRRKSILKDLSRFGKSSGQAMVCSMSVNPRGDQLATIEVSGHLAVWDLPSFKLKRSWTLQEQPQSELSESDLSIGKKKGQPLPIEVSWWSDDALILVNTAGQVTVPSVHNLKNLLGDHPEPGSAITHGCNGQFLILECESSSSSVGSRFRVPSLSEESEPDDESPSKTELSFTGASSRLLKQVMYFLTESDRFRPPKKKPKVTKKRYSLACLKSMPPEECYERKMLNEEYGEALVLAQQYGLDCDLVYQRQWRSYPVAIATIQDYLSKISKRSEVLYECMNRVPDEYEATKELLQYGLSRTTFKELKEAGVEGEDLLGLERPVIDEDDLCLEEMEKEISKWDRLNSEQFSICQYRHLLLMYLDRLATYEVFLGGPRAADESFNGCVFEEFRSGNLVQSAINYARDGDWKAVEALFTYHGHIVLPHRLSILSNFPETLTPQTYENLLPSVSDGCVDEWEKETHRDKDWVESEALSKLCVLPDETHTNTGDFIYEENPEWRQYVSPSSVDVLTEWYRERATEIEEFSGQVDCALQLIELGVENGVQGLRDLHHHLQTLHTLVYQCNADSRLTLGRLQAMSDLEILQLMLMEPSGSDFVTAFIDCAVPFLTRLDSLNRGAGDQLLIEYLTQLAKTDLEPCLSLFLQSRGKGPQGSRDPVIHSNRQLMLVALKVVYASQRGDQLSIADRIVECLPVSAVASGCASQGISDLHAQVDQLENHLSALDILQTYGVHKPVHYIRDIQSDPVEAKQLMVKLTRVASRRDPPMTESSWRNLLQHLLSLRSRVFSCVDVSSCYRVFAESLLCSGQEANIHLASQLLTLSSQRPSSKKSLTGSPRHSSSPSFNFHLPYDVSCELVLNAAKEYFNSAASLMDKDMDLARECLSLFLLPTGPVQSELNLIASLSLLDDFGIAILPLQVRLSENKLDIIRSVLDSSSTSYKNYENIIRLSRLLDDGGSVSEDSLTGAQMSLGVGHTIILTVLAAIQQKDFKLSEKLCYRLVEARFSPAWEVCRKLATDSSLCDSSTKMTFMNFCLTHCPPEEIEDTLKRRQNLEVQSLCEKYAEDTTMKQSGRGKSSSIADSAAAKIVGRGVKGIVKGAGAMQQLIRTRQMVDSSNQPSETRSSKQSLGSMITELNKMADIHSTADTPKQKMALSSHPFYIESGTEVSQTFRYSEWSGMGAVSVKLAVNQALLRAVQVANMMAKKDEEKLECSKVLLELAKECSSIDTHLMLGYLLALSTAEDADDVFSSLPKTKLSLELAIFYFCLQFYTLSSPLSDDQSGPTPYAHAPAVIVDHVTNRLMSCDLSNWPETLGPLVDTLHKYQEMLEDHNQAEVLLSLGLGIDIDQFEEDGEYKHSIVLSLARTMDDKVFSIACQLAGRHQIPEWELYMELLDTLLTTSLLKPLEVQQRIKESKIMDTVLCNPQQTYNRLSDTTYHRLRGDKLTVMLAYYSVLQQCAEKGASLKESIPIATHIKILKRLKANVTGVDYKHLMSGEVHPLDVLRPALTANNVHFVAKLADKIPIKDCGVMTSGMVFRAYTEILFWKGDTKSQEPESTSKWIHRYEACHEFLSKLGVTEVKQFVKNILFTKQSLKLGLETRLELAKRSQRFCQQRIKQESEDTGFQHLKKELEVYSKHLKILSSSELNDVVTKYSLDETRWDEYSIELDFSLSEPDKVRLLGLKMITDAVPIELLQTILALTNTVCAHKLTVGGLVREVLEECIENLSHMDSRSEDSVHIEKLEKVLMTVSNHESQGGQVVGSSQVLEVLQPFCSNSSFNAESRRALLQFIEKYLYLSDEDFGLLLLYQTQSLLAKNFDTKVSLDSVSTSDSRQNLFSSLLSESKTLDKLLDLFSLLQVWENPNSSQTKCWCDLLLAVAGVPEAFEHIVVMRAGLRDIPSDVDKTLLAQIAKLNLIETLKLSLVCSNSETIQSTLHSLSSEVDVDHDPNLLELIITTDNVVVIRRHHPQLYAQLCEHLKCFTNISSLNIQLFTRLLQCSEAEVKERLDLTSPSVRVKKAAQQLYRDGMVIDAGTLLLHMQDFHIGLGGLNDAIGYVGGLFS